MQNHLVWSSVLTTMNALLVGLLCSLTPLVATAQEAQDPQRSEQPAPKPESLEQQLQKAIAATIEGDAKSKAKASQTIKDLCETHYPECFAIYEASKHEVLRNVLAGALHLNEIRAAHVILLATDARGEQAQGGVVDHHDLWLKFAKLQVLAADQTAKQDYLIEQQFLLVRGTHADTWLCDLMQRDIERHRGENIWVLKRRLLMHDGDRSGVTLHEFVRLPANAAAAVRKLRK